MLTPGRLLLLNKLVAAGTGTLGLFLIRKLVERGREEALEDDPTPIRTLLSRAVTGRLPTVDAAAGKRFLAGVRSRGMNLEAFDEGKHPRDHLGRFTFK